jgi:hypothetical protein
VSETIPQSTVRKARSRDRRLAERYEVARDVFLSLGPSFERTGSVRDISKTGISFEYLSFENLGKPENGKSRYAEAYLLSKSDDLYISRIPCEIVYDSSKGGAAWLHNTETRLCGLKFGNLNDQQNSKLLAFLDKLA